MRFVRTVVEIWITAGELPILWVGNQLVRGVFGVTFDPTEVFVEFCGDFIRPQPNFREIVRLPS